MSPVQKVVGSNFTRFKAFFLFCLYHISCVSLNRCSLRFNSTEFPKKWILEYWGVTLGMNQVWQKDLSKVFILHSVSNHVAPKVEVVQLSKNSSTNMSLDLCLRLFGWTILDVSRRPWVDLSTCQLAFWVWIQLLWEERAVVVAQAHRKTDQDVPSLIPVGSWAFFSSLFYLNQWCVLNEGPRGGATVLIFQLPREK